MSSKSINERLRELRSDGLYRRLETRPATGGKLVEENDKILNFSSNDYLDLANHPRVKKEAHRMIEEYGGGATASRLVTGTLECHEKLEQRLAEMKGYPAALVFGSGYLTNLGVITALLGKNDYLFVDRLAHASIIDGLLQSRAEFHRFRHNDLDHLADQLENTANGGRKLIVTESLFSMDGDRAPLAGLVQLAQRHEAMLLVDEAHATGVFGSAGCGLVAAEELTDQVDISMATLSKALGSYGGMVACSQKLKEFFINRARSFIYSTALPPASVGAVLGALDVLADQPELGSEVLERASFFRRRLQKQGLDTGNSSSQIIPVIVGENELTLEFARRLEKEGLLAVAIRPPTVPRNVARIRFSVTLAHSREELADVAELIGNTAKELGVI